MASDTLPYPNLVQQRLGEILAYTDPQLFQARGTRIAFTGRQGGVSTGCYGALNLATHVEDDPQLVAMNRQMLMDALGASGCPLIVPNQMHGSNVVTVGGAGGCTVPKAQAAAAEGADALVVADAEVAACLCYADCLPLVLVAPSGIFAVVHSGWRGTLAGIAGVAAKELAQAEAAQTGVLPAEALSQMNAYIGPYLHSECFEIGPDLIDKFIAAFGTACLEGGNVSLGQAVRLSLAASGVDMRRVADVGRCTKCNPQEFFSYRASGGVCGRHGAAAIRMKG